jgi:hypothetical protein
MFCFKLRKTVQKDMQCLKYISLTIPAALSAVRPVLSTSTQKKVRDHENVSFLTRRAVFVSNFFLQV